MYKEDLALNNLQCLICYKTQGNQIIYYILYMYIYTYIHTYKYIYIYICVCVCVCVCVCLKRICH